MHMWRHNTSCNKTFIDDRRSLAMMHMWRHNTSCNKTFIDDRRSLAMMHMWRHNTSCNKTFIDDRRSLAMMHMWRHNACFHHNARSTSSRSLMAYFVPSRNGEESFNQSLSPDPDHPRGGPNHGHNTSCVKKSSQSVQ